MISLRSMSLVSNGVRFRKPRRRRITSPARWSSRLMSARMSLTSSRSGLSDFRISSAVSALVRIDPSGWLSSCAIEDDNSLVVACRLTCASSVIRICDSTSASRRRWRSCSRNRISAGLDQQRGDNGHALPAILLHERRLAKADFAALGKADSPTFQRCICCQLKTGFTPRLIGGMSDGTLAIEDAQRKLCGVRANGGGIRT